jgi:hypothetical protein
MPNREICEGCRAAVLRTYHEMLGKGQDEVAALRSAMHVLAIRHPEQPARLRADMLERWLAGDEGRLCVTPPGRAMG